MPRTRWGTLSGAAAHPRRSWRPVTEDFLSGNAGASAPLSPEDDARDALKAVMVQQADRELAERRPQRARRDVMPIVWAVLVAACAWIWFGDPAFLRAPAAPEPTAAERDAGRRLALYLQAQRIEHFRVTHARLPVTLIEAGSQLEGVRYDVFPGDRYRLIWETDEKPLVWRSMDRPDVFLGSSLARLGLQGEDR